MVNWKKILLGELSWKRLVKSVLSIYIILMVIAVALGDYFIFAPPEPSYIANDKPVAFITTEDNKESIATVYLPAKDTMPTLLWSHGNAEDLGYIYPFLEAFHSAGFGILAYDYPGYGLSTGEPSDHSVYRSVDAIYQHAITQLKIPDSQLIAVGQSVGSGPACYIAEKQNLAALVLVAPLTSVYRVAFHYPIFPRDRFPNIQRIPNITTPIMVIHGDQDTVIPEEHSQNLLNKHTGFHIYHRLEGRGHNNITGTTYDDLAAYIQLFSDFAKNL